MRKYLLSKHLQDKLKKLSKKDKVLYEQVIKKIEEILSCESIGHYKNLKHDLSDSKRVHIGHFVLVFRFEESSDTLFFDELEHHDKAYCT
jgi:mRNA-degrading endonuclease RelE of RelBE toxin-antitoxin system